MRCLIFAEPPLITLRAMNCGAMRAVHDALMALAHYFRYREARHRTQRRLMPIATLMPLPPSPSHRPIKIIAAAIIT